MKSRTTLRIVLIVIGVVFCAALAWAVAGRRAQPASSADPSYALLTAPLDGDILLLGDPVYVTSTGFLSKPDLGPSQLYLDGSPHSVGDGPSSEQSLPVCPSDSAEICGSVESEILWIPSAAGRHTLQVCFNGNEPSPESWQVCTDPIAVTVADPSAQFDNTGAYSAGEGDTLQSVAEKFGLPPVIVAAANPDVDPSVPLAQDTAVNIPALPPADTAPAGDLAGSPRTFTSVRMTVDLPVEKVYCYYSLGEDYWTRLPAAPQSFAYPLNGELDLTANFRSVTLPANDGFLAMECWGWSGNTLIALGSGQSTLPPGSEAQLSGDHFQLNGSLAPAPNAPAHPMGGTPPPTPPPGAKLMPPINLRRTGNLSECINHFPPAWELIGTLFCKAAVERSDFILIWDRSLFPVEGYTTEIQGYKVYKTNSSGVLTLIKTIPDPGQRILILPPDVLTSPPPTFCVRSYFGSLQSTQTCYVAAPEAMGLTMVSISPVPHSENELSFFTDETRKLEEDCDDIGLGSDAIEFMDDKSIIVGFYHRYKAGCIEIDDTYYRGSLLFDLKKIEGPVSSAVLKYVQGKTVATDGDGFSESGQSCADTLNISTEVSTSGITGFDPYRFLSKSGFPGKIHSVNVTEAVRDWTLGTPNLGFLFIGRDESFPESIDRLDKCWSRYDTFILNVTYFVK